MCLLSSSVYRAIRTLSTWQPVLLIILFRFWFNFRHFSFARHLCVEPWPSSEHIEGLPMISWSPCSGGKAGRLAIGKVAGSRPSLSKLGVEVSLSRTPPPLTAPDETAVALSWWTAVLRTSGWLWGHKPPGALSGRKLSKALYIKQRDINGRSATTPYYEHCISRESNAIWQALTAHVTYLSNK